MKVQVRGSKELLTKEKYEQKKGKKKARNDQGRTGVEPVTSGMWSRELQSYTLPLSYRPGDLMPDVDGGFSNYSVYISQRERDIRLF